MRTTTQRPFSSWYGVRCFFQREDGFYEERITVWRADSFDEAVVKGEEEARSYAETVELVYLKLAQAYLIGKDVLSEGSEVFSLIRKSALPANDYLNHFFDTGEELQGTIPAD